jgi:hypothetical protein
MYSDHAGVQTGRPAAGGISPEIRMGESSTKSGTPAEALPDVRSLAVPSGEMLSVQEVSPIGLICLVGKYAGTADRILGTRTEWTMFVYAHLGKIDFKFVERFERMVNRRMKERGSEPLYFKDVL